MPHLVDVCWDDVYMFLSNNNLSRKKADRLADNMMKSYGILPHDDIYKETFSSPKKYIAAVIASDDPRFKDGYIPATYYVVRSEYGLSDDEYNQAAKLIAEGLYSIWGEKGAPYLQFEFRVMNSLEMISDVLDSIIETEGDIHKFLKDVAKEKK